MSANIYRQALKCVTQYVEACDGDWSAVRRNILLDVDFLFREGTDGAKLFAYALDGVYQEMKPVGAP